MKKIGIIAEYNAAFPPHVATSRAIKHSSESLGIDVTYEWVSTEKIERNFFELYDGLWVAPGSPYKNMARTLGAIRHARENGIPTIGTCGGFQHIVIEYARNLLGIQDAQHAEYDPYASKLFISESACSLAGREMELKFESDSKVSKIYGLTCSKEFYYCNFSVNPEFITEIRSGPIKITGSDSEGEVRVIEYPKHPFFIATLFVPQMRSTAERPHPLVNAFLDAIIGDEREALHKGAPCD